MTNWGSTQERVDVMHKSIESLIETTKHLPVEIIVVDNPATIDSSEYFFQLLKDKKIVSYTRNADNMHFGFARNQGIAMAKGEYLASIDNDIWYKDGWLDKCLDILEAYPDKKIYATPIQYSTPVMDKRYDQGTLELNGEMYRLNMRAGSNCFVIRRKDFDEIGNFIYHRIAGSKWTDTAVKKGYLAAVTPTNMVDDMGFRKGYDLNKVVPIVRKLLNGSVVYFNNDGYQKGTGR